VIIKQPGVRKTESSSNLSFIWELDKPFPISVWSWFRIYDDDDAEKTLLLEFQWSYDGSELCSTFHSTRLWCIVDGPRIGFTLFNVNDSDAGRYTLHVEEDELSDPSEETDSNAFLYIISKNIC
ncbi:hypothetical protein LSH36_997g02047, partial [Paralvinella palmiformis]